MFKQEVDDRHPLFNHQCPPSRLKSHRSFMKTSSRSLQRPAERRIELWNQNIQNPWISIKEELTVEPKMKYRTWKAINRLRVGVT